MNPIGKGKSNSQQVSQGEVGKKKLERFQEIVKLSKEKWVGMSI